MLRSRDTAIDNVRQLKVENELLTAEVRRLRDELAQVRSTAAGRRATRELEDDSNREREAEALTDIRWLVSRLDSPPFGKVLRSRAGFRALLDKYSSSGS